MMRALADDSGYGGTGARARRAAGPFRVRFLPLELRRLEPRAHAGGPLRARRRAANRPHRQRQAQPGLGRPQPRRRAGPHGDGRIRVARRPADARARVPRAPSRDPAGHAGGAWPRAFRLRRPPRSNSWRCSSARPPRRACPPGRRLAGQPPKLRPVDPRAGWLVERWHPGTGRSVPPAPFDRYTGDPAQAFWEFDEESARATQDYLADQTRQEAAASRLGAGRQTGAADRQPQPGHAAFRAGSGRRHVSSGGNVSSTRWKTARRTSSRWTGLPAGAPLGHAAGGGPVIVSRITGPVAKKRPGHVCPRAGPGLFHQRQAQLRPLAAGEPAGRRRIQERGAAGGHARPAQRRRHAAAAHVSREIPDQPAGVSKSSRSPPLRTPAQRCIIMCAKARRKWTATSLRLTPIPPGARFPVKVTVVAWQWGHAAAPKLDTAEPVERTFSLLK